VRVNYTATCCIPDDEQVVRLSVHHRGGSVAHGPLRADVVAQGNGGCPEYRRAPRFAYCPNFLLGWRTQPSAMTSRPIRKSYGPLCPNCWVDPTSSRSHLTSLCGGTQRTMLVFPTGSATVTRMWRLACPLPLTRRSSASGCRRQAVTVVVEDVGRVNPPNRLANRPPRRTAPRGCYEL
jgi:hypothetical protein